MLKFVLGVCLGLGLIVGGIYSSYMFLISINNGGNIFILFLTILLFGIGIYMIYKLSNAEVLVCTKLKRDTSDSLDTRNKFQSMLERNNEISREWTETVERKDKLKMIKMAATEKEHTEIEARTT